MDPVLLERDGGIVIIALNNPQGRNALTLAMWRHLSELMVSLSSDDTVRCIVLRDAGDKAFTDGFDITEFPAERADSRQARRYGKVIDATLRAVAGCRHPTVALIKGVCVDGGLEIAALCDMRICGESSGLGITVNRLALNLSYVELQALLSIAGRATTLELLLEGRILRAPEALQKNWSIRW